MANPVLLGLHHLKFPVTELWRSLAFYERAFGARRIENLDHQRPDGSIYAIILEVDGLGTHLELRLDPDGARRQAGFDPVTIAVRDRSALANWIARLDAAEIAHSPVLVSTQAWLVVFADPDDRRLRLYTRERHGPELQPDEASPWITVS